MVLSYYQILSISYLAAVGLWWIFASVAPAQVAPASEERMEKPWIKSGLMVLCALLTVGVGSLYSSKMLLPDWRLGSLRWGEVINQAFIFSPFPLYLWLSKESCSSAWLPGQNWWKRLVVGTVLALIALFIFVLLAGRREPYDVISDVYNIKNTHHAVQVFFEDLAIAMFLARLSQAMGKKYFVLAILTVAIAFPMAHLPADLAGGEALFSTMVRLLNDALLVFVVGFALFRFKDFLWLFPLHFVMDMMQFHSGITIHS